ncbi:MAG: protein-disulfide isomerase [Acidimicrobiales bacterium]|nr:protein-disulfide isomerase [Acidimicrobiales bacterium]
MDQSRQFSVTFDYRCPFARNLHEHLAIGIKAGANWDVDVLPFFLDQAQVEDGEPSAWDNPKKRKNTIPLCLASLLKSEYPESFWDLHTAIFEARHELGRNINDLEVLTEMLVKSGVPGDYAKSLVISAQSENALEALRKAHETLANDFLVFGNPTFIIGESAVFLRIMERPRGDATYSIQMIEKVLDTIILTPEINELKHTRLPR